MRIYEFPFESVKRDSRIIIYGAGSVGQTYLHQVSLTKYCKVIAIIDQDFARYGNLSCPVVPVSSVR